VDFDALVTGRHPEPALQRLRARLGPEVERMRAELARPTTTPHGLTAREVEVLTLLADGLSNKEIAARLFISTKTASVHVSNILRKLDVPARGAAVALAYREAIIDAPVGVAPRE
jgi:DNA-binding NarL/FixJ family response regulator